MDTVAKATGVDLTLLRKINIISHCVRIYPLRPGGPWIKTTEADRGRKDLGVDGKTNSHVGRHQNHTGSPKPWKPRGR